MSSKDPTAASTVNEIELEFIGGAQTVTGSKHLLKTSQAKVLLDCGLFQGHRKEANEKNRNFSIDVAQITAVVLSHAHIDHSGALPCLVKNGYRGPIYVTPATRDLCLPMLLDTAWIMKADAEHIEKLIARGVRNLEAAEPLYGESDVQKTIEQMIPLDYHRSQTIAPGVNLTFLDAGHVLGSAISVFDINDRGRQIRLAFTGDLGRRHLPILRDPEVPTGVSHLLMESTYGDRLHDPIELTSSALSEVINRTYRRGGKVIIPTFALERAQEVIFELKKLIQAELIAPLRVYVDSPLTVKLTNVFKQHPECFSSETFELLKSDDSPFDFPGLEYISEVEDSKRVSASTESCIVLSASGMCEGGRILHHLSSTIEDAKNTIVIVGYQAEATLGRRILEKRPEIKIYGVIKRLLAEVCVLNGFSGHADQNGLLHFCQTVQAAGSIKKVMLVHGEVKAQTELALRLAERGFKDVAAPAPGERIVLL